MEPQIKREVADAIKSAESEQLVQGSAKILAILQRHGLMHKQRLHPDYIGVHPKNRDGLGLNSQDVLELISNIAAVGFDDSIPNPLCVEIPMGDTRTKAFNEELVNQSGGIIPAFNSNCLKYASIAASHTNAALRVLSHASLGVLGQHDDLMVHGRFSLEMLQRKDPAFRKGCDEGLEWKVINEVVVTEFPELPALLQAASNCTGHLAKGEHEIQMMRRIFNMVEAAAKDQRPYGWSDLKNQILRSKPQCSEAAPFMHRFVCKYSVGQKGLWEHVEQFLRTAAASGRQLGAEFFEALASEPKPLTSDLIIYIRHAVLLTAYTAPQKLLTVSDVKRILGKDFRPRAESANALILKCWKLVTNDQQLKMNFQVKTAMAAFEIDLVLMVLHKRHQSLSVAETEEEAACKLMDSIEVLQNHRVSNEWDGCGPQEEESQGSASVAAILV